MPTLPEWLDRYRRLPAAAHRFAAGQFLVQLIYSAQFLLLNLFLKSRGLDDPAIAALTSNRFLATLFLALPAGLWLRGRPLRMPTIIGGFLFPIAALASLETVQSGAFDAAAIWFMIMGGAGLIGNVTSLPMMMRLVPERQSSEGVSLLFAVGGAASICGALLSTALQSIGHVHVDTHDIALNEHTTLLILTLCGFGAPFLYLKLPDPVVAEKPTRHWLHVDREDLPVLFRALVPTLCIATGAGLSIQFLNLFFSHVYKVFPEAYSAYGSMSYVLVFITGLCVPEVKRRLGWRGAILGVQTAGVVMLVLMGLSEIWKTEAWAFPVAILCFIFRQPLMNMAGPSTSELTMTYAGERNRELMSACGGAIWSGAWWIAARVFAVLREHHFEYWQVFLTTAALYLVGTFSYTGLIRSVEKREVEEEVVPMPATGGEV